MRARTAYTRDRGGDLSALPSSLLSILPRASLIDLKPSFTSSRRA